MFVIDKEMFLLSQHPFKLVPCIRQRIRWAFAYFLSYVDVNAFVVREVSDIPDDEDHKGSKCLAAVNDLKNWGPPVDNANNFEDMRSPPHGPDKYETKTCPAHDSQGDVTGWNHRDYKGDSDSDRLQEAAKALCAMQSACWLLCATSRLRKGFLSTRTSSSDRLWTDLLD